MHVGLPANIDYVRQGISGEGCHEKRIINNTTFFFRIPAFDVCARQSTLTIFSGGSSIAPRMISLRK